MSFACSRSHYLVFIFLPKKMEVEGWITLTIEVLALLAFCVNAYCFYYVIKTFNIKQCLNHVMCIDSSSTAIASILIFVFYAAGLRNSWMCAELTFAATNAPNLTVVCNYITAYIRYKRVLTSMNNQTWKTEKELMNQTNKALLFATILWLVVVAATAIFETKWLGIYNHCIDENAGVIAWVGIILRLVRISIIIYTIVIDIKCLKLVRRIMNHPNPAANNQLSSEEQRHSINEIPMRSTILNLGYVLLTMTALPIMIAHQVKTIEAGTIGLLIILMLQTPVTVFWTIRVNDVNARVDEEAAKEQRRQLEIEEALKKREERRKLQAQPLQVQDLEANEIQETVC